ncbi:MAG: glycosyl hydrolase 53 family protein [Defluviitaleaceae bacterium]|nr:glycosyl hydrolase 53 family protein [Defluviitaleaceae bacterium]
MYNKLKKHGKHGLLIGIMLFVVIVGVFVAFRLFRDADINSEIFVERVELNDDFMLGADISSVLSLEESGVTFHGFDGNEADLFQLFADGGANYVRVRIWNDPWYYDGTTLRGFGGGNNDVPRAIEIGRRATAAGMQLLVNFHYSDFWADPAKQMVPRAWEDMNVDEKAEALYQFTYNTIIEMLEAGIDIGMVQIGNETNNGIAGVTGWPFKVRLFAAGSAAIIDAERDFRISQGENLEEYFPRNIRIAIHKTNPENFWDFTQAGLSLASAGVVYDVFGISYYPFWHGSLENLVELMNLIANTFDVDVAVLETSYAFTREDTDGHTNSWSGYMTTYNYPISVQGQANAIRDVVAAVASVERGIGVFLWEPAWITVGSGDRATNEPIWEEHGSGWASSFAAIYDPYDAGTYWGGSSWDNQAFFDHNGHPLPTLNLFNYLQTGAVSRHGNHIDMILHSQSEAIRNPNLDITNIVDMLPETVTAVFANNDRVPASIIWNMDDITEALDIATSQGGVATIQIRGQALANDYMLDFSHTLTLSPGNLVQNHSFEDQEMDMWRINFHGDAQGYANRGMDNVRTGDFGFRWWRSANQPIHFSIEQDINDLPAGYYGFETFITGGDAGTGWEIYIYVLINEEFFARQDTALPGWQNWNNPAITNIPVQDGDIVTIGVMLNIENTNGAWGTLDDFFFYNMSVE